MCERLCVLFSEKVFEELEEIGKTLKDEVMDAGMPVHGEMDGDINKCPYYTAKMGEHGCVDNCGSQTAL